MKKFALLFIAMAFIEGQQRIKFHSTLIDVIDEEKSNSENIFERNFTNFLTVDNKLRWIKLYFMQIACAAASIAFFVNTHMVLD